MYSKEDCGRNDPSLSPGSRSGRGAMTLTLAPNGAKAFNIANRTSERWQRKNVPSSARGFEHSAEAKYKELALNPSAKRPARLHALSVLLVLARAEHAAVGSQQIFSLPVDDSPSWLCVGGCKFSSPNSDIFRCAQKQWGDVSSSWRLEPHARSIEGNVFSPRGMSLGVQFCGQCTTPGFLHHLAGAIATRRTHCPEVALPSSTTPHLCRVRRSPVWRRRACPARCGNCALPASRHPAPAVPRRACCYVS